MTTKKTAKTKTAAAKKIADAAEKVTELKAARLPAVRTAASNATAEPGAENRQPGSGWKWALILLLCLWGLNGVKGCVSAAHERFADWKRNLIQRLIPSPPDPFKRERRTRPDRNDGDGGGDDRGIIWRFTRGVGGSGSLASWIRKNVPAVPASGVYDVADAFYDAADTIAASPAIDEPAEAVAAVRQRLLFVADAGWADFLAGLDRQANAYGVESIADVIEFYYAVGTALYDAAGVKSPAPEPLESAAAEPAAEEAPPEETEPSGAKPDQEPPSDPAALPPAEPVSSDRAEPEQTPAEPAQNCPNGSCPNAAPRYNYGYGYNYGWRWY